MQFKDFYLTVTSSRENATAFLREHVESLLDTAEETLLCYNCGSEMLNARKHDLRCDFWPVFL